MRALSNSIVKSGGALSGPEFVNIAWFPVLRAPAPVLWQAVVDPEGERVLAQLLVTPRGQLVPMRPRSRTSAQSASAKWEGTSEQLETGHLESTLWCRGQARWAGSMLARRGDLALIRGREAGSAPAADGVVTTQGKWGGDFVSYADRTIILTGRSEYVIGGDVVALLRPPP